MSGDVAYELRKGAYFDSIVLMQLQRALVGLEQVHDAGAVMATRANLELLEQNNLLPEGVDPAPEDLMIVVRAVEGADPSEALAQIDELLAKRRTAGSKGFNPRSLEAAVKALPEAKWVLISVPGRYAADVAHRALELERNVFLYSDNVSIEDEVALKERATEAGLLMMGPDCGTALVNGIGFGFANRVRRGPIGLVGASGTGMQAITVGVHRLGSGISHALGTGGRDLKAPVGGRMALAELDLLAADSETEVIVLVSKPPDEAVTSELLRRSGAAGKPVVVDFIGYPAPADRLDNVHFANSLTEAAEIAVHLSGDSTAVGPRVSSRGYLRGLFSGGTLATEALHGLRAMLGEVHSNLDDPRLEDSLVSVGHTVLDLGEDEFTVGRLHPMIDNDLRLRRMRQEAADPEVKLLLLDVVLGEGSHPDPASELAPAIDEIRSERDLPVAVMLVGTDEDPQDLGAQRAALEAAGAEVVEDTSHLVERALAQFSAAERPAVDPGFLREPVAAINVGLESFHASLIEQGAQSVHVDWRPPAGGNERLQSILEKMRS